MDRLFSTPNDSSPTTDNLPQSIVFEKLFVELSLLFYLVLRMFSRGGGRRLAIIFCFQSFPNRIVLEGENARGAIV